MSEAKPVTIAADMMWSSLTRGQTVCQASIK
jgi:hypothetical protein